MKILLVTAMFPPIATGTSYYAMNLAKILADRKHRVEVVTVKNRHLPEEKYPFPVHRLSAIHLPLKSFFMHFFIAALFPWNYIRLKRIAKRSEAEVILLINHYLDIAFTAIFVSRILGLPLVCSVGTQLQSTNPRHHKILNILDRLICGRLIFPFCHRVIAWDNEIVRYLQDVHGASVVPKTSIVNFGPNGDVALLLAYEHKYVARNQVLGIGAVTEQRDFIALVRAFRLLSDEYPTLTLKIVGHVYHNAAVRLAAEIGLKGRVVFTGERPHDEVLEELKRSDIFFVSLSGRYRGLGTATLEAMFLGVPVVANVPLDLLGSVTLRDMEHLVHCDGLSPEKIASKIRQLLSNGQLRREVGQGGRDFVRKNLSWEKVGEDMERVLNTVLQKA